MSILPRSKEALLGWAAILVAWISVTLIAATAWHLDGYWVTPNATWLETVGQHGSVWFLWAALSPLLFSLARRHPIAGPRWPSHILLYVVISLLWAGFYFGVMTLLITVWNGRSVPSEWRSTAEGVLTYTTLLEYFVFWVLVLAGHAYWYFRRWRAEREQAADLALQNSELSTKLAEAELTALRSQLQPHFLFNTLNSIVGHIRTGESDVAQRVTVSLSELLRYTLERQRSDFVPAATEFDFVQKYLQIQKSRFGDRLEVEIRLEAGEGTVLLPPLILQPLVENAVHHGVSGEASRNWVHVTGARVDDRFRVEIRNSRFQGIEDHPGFGIGVHNVRERLLRTYGQDMRFEVKESGGDEMIAILEVPADGGDSRT